MVPSTGAREPNIGIIRGPLVLCLAVSLYLAPYILLNFSIYWILFICFELLLLAFGFALLLLDVKLWLHETCTPIINRGIASVYETFETIDSLVLDDVLQSTFDPHGWIAASVGTMTGTVLTYGLPCITQEQRIEILSSVMYIPKSEARSLLLEPGGFVQLFPSSFRNFLTRRRHSHHPDSRETNSNDRSGVADRAQSVELNIDSPVFSLGAQLDDSSSAASSDAEVDMTETLVASQILLNASNTEMPCKHQPSMSKYQQKLGHKRRLPVAPSRATESISESHRSAEPLTITIPSPVSVFSSILMEHCKSRLLAAMEIEHAENLARIGLSASAVVLTQLAFSKRARRILAFVIEGSTLAGAVSMLAGSLVGSMAFQKVNVTNRNTVRAGSSVWDAWLSVLRKERKWQGLLAALIMLYFSRRRKLMSSAPN